MHPLSYERLIRLRDKYGEGVFGKIAQKLLAVTFWDAGSLYVVERGVQGVDLDVVTADEVKYAIEVKTTGRNQVMLDQDNIRSLTDRSMDGYHPTLAGLQIAPLGDWLFSRISLDGLRPGPIPVRHLRLNRVTSIEDVVRPLFNKVLEEHFAGTLRQGEQYLLRVLRSRESRSRTSI